MASTTSIASFARSFSALSRQDTSYIDIGGRDPLPARAWPSKGARALVVLFHGAVNRKSQQYPAFHGFIPEVHPHAHQISVADPGLLAGDDTTNGWFVGTRETRLQKLLPTLFDTLREDLGVERTIFTGGSGGGYAALYYSWRMPGSIALALAPQTNILDYHGGRRNAYLKPAWGNVAGSLRAGACLDLADIYRESVPNVIVYLQSVLDSHHLEKHMIPFVTSLGPNAGSHLVLQSSYWGTPGHARSVPAGERRAWLMACLDASEAKPEPIVQSYHLANPSRFGGESAQALEKAPTRTPIDPASNPSARQRDIELAARITHDTLLQEDSYGK